MEVPTSRLFRHPKWDQLFGIDLRSLAVLRIGLALLVLTDLFDRLPDLEAHYTDQGVLPRFGLPTGLFGLHSLSGSAW